MPELPEVEVIKQSLEKYIVNKKILKIIVKNKNLRYPVPENISKKLTNIKIQKVKRISKYLIIEFKNELFLLIHLGMSGTLHLIKCKNNFKNTNLSFYHSKNLPKRHNHIFLNFKNRMKLLCLTPAIFAPTKQQGTPKLNEILEGPDALPK